MYYDISFNSTNTHNATHKYVCLLFFFVVFNATFSNISAISGRSVLLVKATGGPRESH
jgi:hypothetical protein